MASPVSCKNRKRRCLNSQMVRMVRVRSRMKMSRSALSCLWLSSALFSVTMFSMALSSWGAEGGGDDARHTQTHTDKPTSMSSHSVLVALQAPLALPLPAISAVKRRDVFQWTTTNFVRLLFTAAERAGNCTTAATEKSIAARKWILFYFFLPLEASNVYFNVKALRPCVLVVCTAEKHAEWPQNFFYYIRDLNE